MIARKGIDSSLSGENFVLLVLLLVPMFNFLATLFLGLLDDDIGEDCWLPPRRGDRRVEGDVVAIRYNTNYINIVVYSYGIELFGVSRISR